MTASPTVSTSGTLHLRLNAFERTILKMFCTLVELADEQKMSGDFIAFANLCACVCVCGVFMSIKNIISAFLSVCDSHFTHYSSTDTHSLIHLSICDIRSFMITIIINVCIYIYHIISYHNTTPPTCLVMSDCSSGDMPLNRSNFVPMRMGYAVWGGEW